MKLAKKLLAGSLALLMAASMVSCEKSGGDEDASSAAPAAELSAKQEALVKDLLTKLPDKELKNKTVKWLGHYDINPSDGKIASPALEAFKQKYGGEIKTTLTTFETRYDKLATAVLSGDSPDFFPADDMDAFPKGVNTQFDPIDDYIDFNSELWSDTKAASDVFSINGKHYVAVIRTTPRYACFYNKTTIEDEGLDDPAELFEQGKWDWDAFEDMCIEFTDADEKKYGLDGYWYNNAISETSGVPLITIEDGKLIQNMSDPKIEKVQTRMYNLQKNEVVFPRVDNNWNTRGNGDTGDGLGSHLTLFIPVGLWAIENTVENTKLLGDVAAGEVMFVPMPKDPDSDTYYISAQVNGYLMCHDAPNPEGFATYMECVKMATKYGTDDMDDEQLKNVYKWNDEMIAMRKKLYEMVAEHPVLDLQNGVSSELKTQMEKVSQATMITGGDATTWTECRTANEGGVEYLIKDTNETLAKGDSIE